MPVLFFLGYINSIKNKLWEEEHKQTGYFFMEKYGPTSYWYKGEKTSLI